MVLGALILAGSTSIASCYLLIYKNDLRCRMRDPMILTPLTLAGSILLARVWRIVILLTPVLQAKPPSLRLKKTQQDRQTSSVLGNSISTFQQDDESITLHQHGKLYMFGMQLKRRLLLIITAMADSYYPVSFVVGDVMCGCCKRLLNWWQLRREIARELSTLPTATAGPQRPRRRHSRTSMALKKQVPIQQLLWVLFLFMIPQLALQICALTIPGLQERLQYESIVLEGVTIAERPVCRSEALGSWPTYLAITLTILPYILTGILSWNASDDLPKIFDEARAMTKSFQFLGLVCAIAVPPLFFLGATEKADTFVYLVTMLVFGVALPPVWFIVYPKVLEAMADSASMPVFVPEDNEDDEASVASGKKLKQQHHTATVRRLLRTKKNKKFLPQGGGTQHQGKSAKLALTIGKMYEEMGLHQKSIDLFDEALAVWHCDPNRDSKENKIGGYTLDEINAFTQSDLEFVVQLLIAKGRVEGTFKSEAADGQKSGAQAWLDALEIYERSPARAKIRDRSFLFPIFSGIFVFLKGNKIQQDSKSFFEQNLGRKFVREARLQGDPVHYTRALAMYCETQARIGKYKSALESFKLLKEIYDPMQHTEQISAAYGTDRSAQAFSQSALWHMQLGNKEAALEACEYVIDELMPSMIPNNILNSCEMLLPIIRIHKPMGNEKRMRDLFGKYVIQNFYTHFGKDGVTPCKPLFKPLMTLLDLCHDAKGYTNLDDTVEWLVSDDNGVLPDFIDSIYTKLCWSMHSLSAELCLRVANQLIDKNGDVGDAQILISKGLDLCKRAEKKMKKKNAVILPIPYELHEPVFSELKELAEAMNMYPDDGDYQFDLGSSKSSNQTESLTRPKNLPLTYLRGRGSDESTSTASSPRPTISRRISGVSSGSIDSLFGRVGSETIPEGPARDETASKSMPLVDSVVTSSSIGTSIPSPAPTNGLRVDSCFQSPSGTSLKSIEIKPGIPRRPPSVPLSVEIEVGNDNEEKGGGDSSTDMNEASNGDV